MAYVDLEIDKADIRVLFGQHDTPLPAVQLPESCTGVLFEGDIKPYDMLGEFLNRDHIVPQNREILQVVRGMGIPFMPAEIIRKRHQRSLEVDFMWQLWQAAVIGLPLRPFNSFLLQPKAIEPNGFKFRDFDGMVETIETFAPVRLVLRLRNIIMAHKTFRLADFQRQTVATRPRLALSVGSMHTGIVRALRMSNEERIRYLMDEPLIEKYYDVYSLSDRYFFQYNEQQTKWESIEF